ncbi:MAG TPA: NUDIX hydrolase [Verrucomicrobiae bacterium]|nr:NUDIX hydrolase [Verrucomicrobiae bacterium]
MAQDLASEEVVLSTKWFELVAKRLPSFAEPHYSIRAQDYVAIVAVDTQGNFLLVRQLRPAVDGRTLEIPSGHVDPGETPEESARKELLEETGYVADQFEFLTHLSPDTGRYSNRMWVFFAGNARPSSQPEHRVEAGIDFVLFPGSVRKLVAEKDFDSALNHAALFAAVLRGRLAL